MNKRPSYLLQVFAAAICLNCAGTYGVAAQHNYPEKTVRMFVGFGPGTAQDVIARILGDKLSQAWGKPVVIENLPGAAGNIAATRVARAERDGYTLLFASASMIVINQSLYEKLPYDPVKDLAPIAQVFSFPNVLFVNRELGAKTVQELIILARQQPNTLTFGHPGVGTTPHLAGELLKSRAKINVQNVPYRGTTNFIFDLIGGAINMAFLPTIGALAYRNESKIIALAVTSLRRFSAFPDVPSIAEVGYPGFEATGWGALMVPAGTPSAVIDKLHADAAAILSLPEMQTRFEELGVAAIGNSPAEFAGVIQAEIPKWAELIKEAGIKPMN